MLGMKVTRSAVTPLFRYRAKVQDRPGNNSASRSLDSFSPRSAHVPNNRSFAPRCPNFAATRASGAIEIDKLMFSRPINSNRHPRKSLCDTLIPARVVSSAACIADARL
jgi:hypothetical protein